MDEPLLINVSVPLWVHVLRVLLSFGFFLIGTALLIWAERRVVALMQSRVGPNRAGPFGLLQTVYDGAKLFFKEDVMPDMVRPLVFKLAPLVSVFVAITAVVVIPLGGTVTLAGERFSLHAADLNVGVLWFLAMGSINVYGIALGGWASQSIYPLLGGVRSTAQMVSYEIAQGLAVASVFVYAGSLRISDIVNMQAASEPFGAGVPGWFILPLFPAFLLFFVGMVAETQRPPFDLPEAEAELVGGFHTEYTGVRFAMFFLAEFMNVITVSAIAVTMFLGGPAGPTLGLPPEIAGLAGTLWFSLKTFSLVFVFILLRGALPRMRYDRLMDLGWKVLIPVGLFWVMATAVIVVATDTFGDPAKWLGLVASLLIGAAMLWIPGTTNNRRRGRRDLRDLTQPLGVADTYGPLAGVDDDVTTSDSTVRASTGAR